MKIVYLNLPWIAREAFDGDGSILYRMGPLYADSRKIAAAIMNKVVEELELTKHGAESLAMYTD